MEPTPVARFARWWVTREDRLRACLYGKLPGEDRLDACEREVSLRSSTAAGHRGYCSPEHYERAHDEAVM